MITLGAIRLTVSSSVGLAEPGRPASPAPAFRAVEREAHLLCAGLTRFVNNLPLVYDLRALADTDAPKAPSSPGVHSMSLRFPVASLLLAAILALSPVASPQAPSSGNKPAPPQPAGTPPERPCDQSSAWQKLDFWVGEWDVFVGDRKVGANRIEKILRGCAVWENWTNIRGRQGKSLFYYNPVTEQWKQVWVTDSGAVKEKTLIAEFDDGGVRFQGKLPREDGSFILDRTTLTPLDDGAVRQLIEQSRDNGRAWKTTFDAIYRRPQTPQPVIPNPRSPRR